jgi:hypothetical protein
MLLNFVFLHHFEFFNVAQLETSDLKFSISPKKFFDALS